MIIKSISAENFGKFDRYNVNLDESINVFYGDNEAGKTTLYEIISLLLFAPATEEEIAETNKLIKKDEKYARVYATINIDGKEISVAREIYVNDTNLSIAEQENVSSLGNVNVPFIGDLTKEMYESFHTIDYYNMATITNNVWQQIIKIIEESHGAPRRTPDYSTKEDQETIVKDKSKFEEEIAKREKENTGLKVKLKESQRKQKRMIKNQDKIDDLISELEDVENNIELESSYLKEADKMNQIRTNIKKTQDLVLELEKHKKLEPWMPNLREYYEKLKLYSDNKANGIENPLDMFDDLEEKEDKLKEEIIEKRSENTQVEKKTETETSTVEEKTEKVEDTDILKAMEKIESVKQNDTQKISDDDFRVSKEKINKFAKDSYQNQDNTANETNDGSYANDEDIDDTKDYMTSTSEYLRNKIEHFENDSQSGDNIDDTKETGKLPKDVKPLEIRKPRDMKNNDTEDEDRNVINTFGQTNPYSDNVFPDMDKVNYSDKNISHEDNGDDSEDEDKYSLSESNNMPTQTKSVLEKDMNSEDNNGNKKKNGLLEAEEYLNAVNMQEIIEASKEKVDVDEETREEIDRAQLTFKIRAQKIFNEEVDMDELSQKLKKLNTNAIYKTIVRYKSLSQKQRKLEHNVSKVEHKKTSNGTSLALGVVAILSMLLGLACFFIDQFVTLFPEIGTLAFINQVIMELPLNNIIAGNILSGGAFVLIAILLAVAIVLGNDSTANLSEQVSVDDVELDELKNRIRMAKREVIDALKDFPIPSEYLDNPNNTIISIINELREAETAYNDLLIESTMPRNENYRAIWKLTKMHLGDEEMGTDLFDNIAKLRIKIKDYKEELKEIEEKKKEKELKLNEQKKRINMVASTSGFPGMKVESNKSGQLSNFDDFNKPLQSNDMKSPSSSTTMPTSQHDNLSMNINESQSAKATSESTPFGLPPSGTNPSENTPFGLPQVSTSPDGSDTIGNPAQDLPFGLPSLQPNIDAVKEESHQPESNAMNEPKDISYPTESNAFGTTKDTSYPTGGNTFGAAKDTGYSHDDAAFGAVKDSGYLIGGDESGAAKETSLPTAPVKPPAQGAATTPPENDFGIPGINRYSGAEQSNPAGSTAQNDNQYEIPGINKNENSSSIQPGASDEKGSFGIPGINRYTGDTPAIPTESTEDNAFGIPGIKKYDTDAPARVAQTIAPIVPEEKDTQAAPPENDFGIPGIHRYTSVEQSKPSESVSTPTMMETNKAEVDKPAELQEKTTFGHSGGLPGMDRFSNRSEQSVKVAEQNTDNSTVVDVPPIVPVGGTIGAQATGVVAGVAAGTLASSGLPGIEKFSNRGERAIKKQEEAVSATQEQMKKQPMEEDPFAIAGIKKHTGTKQATDETQKAVESEDTVFFVPEIKEAEPEKIIEKDRREKEYDKLLQLLGDSPENTIREVEDLTRALHKEKTKRDNAMASLLKLNDAAVRLSTLSSSKWPYKQKSITASHERIDYLEADKLKINRHLQMLEGKMDDVVYEGTPQAISDRMTAIQEEVEQLKLKNDKHAIAEELIEKQKMLDLSSSADRSHIIDDTSEYMKELTLGKYVKVKINDGLSGLSICDKDGQWFDTTKDRLSQATREQLYLALRISIADLFDEKSLIFPMFFDEALITWDKRRMKAVMRLLSKMSMHRQVIIFTCHDWLKDMISDYLIGAKIIIM